MCNQTELKPIKAPDEATAGEPSPSERVTATPDRLIYYPPRNMWKAKLSRAGDCIIKDYRRSPFLARWYGRLSLRWEEAALRALDGIEGVPRFRGRPTPDSLRMESVPGEPLAVFAPGSISETFLERLTSLFAQIHARGVAHGDAHLRNILVHEEKPFLIDFSTAYVKGRLPLFESSVFRCFVLLDEERLYKVERRFFGRGTPPKMFFMYRVLKGPR